MSEINTITRNLKNRPFVWIVGLIVIIGIAAARSTLFQADEDTTSNHATFVVKRGPLRISVIESGTIKAREQVIIKNEVEGKTSILSLIEEGIRVKKGDLLIELDSSKLLDQKIDQQIRVKNAEAAFIGARENLAVGENQAQSEIDKAELAYNFAKQDLKKYLEGEYPNELKEAESRITIAREEVTRAREKLEWSRKLFDQKYISQTELHADELAEKKKILELELAQNNLELLENFTYQRKLVQLESDVKQAKMALERTVRKAKADVVQAKANMEAKKAEFARQKDKLKKIEEQIEKTKIYAPADGLVIYATSAKTGGRRRTVEPLQEGQEVRERQELIYLPTTSSAKAEVAIHETSLDKVRIGLSAKITVDALPGETFTGSVAKIAPLPDAHAAWLNPDLKVYNTDIYLDNGNSALRTGMSCKAEIIIEQYQDATYVPVQTVLRVGGEATVYVVYGKTLEPRKVEIGLDNNRMVRIIRGAAAVEPAEYSDDIKKDIIPEKIETKPTLETMDRGTSSERRPEEKEARGGIPGSGVDSEGNRAPRKRTPEQEEKRKQFLQSLSPEERERFRNMSPEEKRRFHQDRMGS